VCCGDLLVEQENIVRLLQCVVACCSVLQRVAVCCSALQCTAVCCRVLQCTCSCSKNAVSACCMVLQCVALCVAVWFSVLQCVAVYLLVEQDNIVSLLPTHRLKPLRSRLNLSRLHVCSSVHCNVLQCMLQFVTPVFPPYFQMPACVWHDSWAHDSSAHVYDIWGHDFLVFVTCLIGAYTRHMSPWLICMCDMPHVYRTHLYVYRTHLYAWHASCIQDSFVCI